MVVLNKIVDFLNSFAPFESAEDYDNVGLLVGDKNKKIKKIMITLDVDEKVVDDAVKHNCDLIISHHPLIFSPLKKVVSDDSCARSVISLIKNDISLISVHTNFDSAKSGLCDLFLDKIIKTSNRMSLDENGIGRIADITQECKLTNIIENIKNGFNLTVLRYVGDKNKTIKKIAVCNGGGAEFIYNAKEMDADLYISGDIKYHHARFAHENDIALVEVPHYNAEIIFCEYVKELLKKEFKKDFELIITDENKDVWNLSE